MRGQRLESFLLVLIALDCRSPFAVAYLTLSLVAHELSNTSDRLQTRFFG